MRRSRPHRRATRPTHSANATDRTGWVTYLPIASPASSQAKRLRKIRSEPPSIHAGLLAGANENVELYGDLKAPVLVRWRAGCEFLLQ